MMLAANTVAVERPRLARWCPEAVWGPIFW